MNRCACDLPVHDDQLYVDVLTVLVQEIRHEVGHRLVCDVTAQHDVSIHTTRKRDDSKQLDCLSLLMGGQ